MSANSRKTYTVKQVAKLSGVSVRALRFYDEIGLLKPAFVGENGYRYYEKEELLALQQILFYRELGFELAMIQKIVTDSQIRQRFRLLRSHRDQLARETKKTKASDTNNRQNPRASQKEAPYEGGTKCTWVSTPKNKRKYERRSY